MRDTSVDMRPSETGIVVVFITMSGEGGQLEKQESAISGSLN